MRLKDIMTKPVNIVTASTTLDKVARQMRESDVGAMPVLEDEKIAGIVTDRDIVLRAVADGLDMHATAVKDVMTANAICHGEDEDIDRALESMRKHKVRRVVVVDRDKRARGIVSLGDLAIRTDAVRETQAVLESVSGVPKQR